MAAAIPFIMLAGTALSAAGSAKAGSDAKKAADNEAAQMQANAEQSFATGTRKSYEAGEDSKALASDIVAAQAAQGGQSNDPQALRQRAKAEAEGEYSVLAELYQGEVSMQDTGRQAAFRRIEGRNAKTAGNLQAAGTALGSMGNFR